MSIRIALFLLALCSLFFTPGWTLLIVTASTLHSRSYEMILIGFLVDTLFLPPGGIPFATLFSVVLVLGFEPLRGEFA